MRRVKAPGPFFRARVLIGRESTSPLRPPSEDSTMSLADALTDASKKPLIVKDCCELIDSEVKDKSGISGLVIKAGYGTVKGIKPGFVEKAVDDLLPEFAKALDPIYADAKSQNKNVSDFFANNAGRVA